jgi:Zn-dependent protease with chaperone function
MDFFEQQTKAQKKTKLLVLYFALAVVSIIVMIYAVAVFVKTAIIAHEYHIPSAEAHLVWWDPQLFAGVALGTLAVILIGSAYKTAALAGGGSVVAESLGGRLLASNTSDPAERKLLNVVEEMSIASGVPVPKVYVLDNEDGINAFAAGHTQSDAVVAVTRPCMAHLTRDELQGVIGHEFSHILNGDMRLNIRLIGILFGIFCIATIGRILLQARSSNSRDKNPIPIIGLLLLIIGALGIFFGRLIQAAVSRQREFLADASSVQFTRNPLGLSGALQKIGGAGSRMASPHAADASHLFFANGLRESFFNWFATHPPLPDRIHAIDQTWDGNFKPLADDVADEPAARGHRVSPPPMPDLMQKILGTAVIVSGESPVIKPRAVLPNLGNPTPLHLKYAEELRNALPEELKAAAREPQDAMALIYAMLLSRDDSQRATQLAGLASRATQPISDKSQALYPEVSQVATRARLPLVNLSLPALRQMNAGQFSQFSQALQWLINSDGEVDLFEFVLQKIVLRHLDSQFNGARKTAVQFYTLKPLVPDCAVILSALAHVGCDDPAGVQKAFDTGAPFLYAPNDAPLSLLPVEQCGIEPLDAALNRLALAVPVIKKNLINACAHVVGADGVILENEAELLRAVADTLDCPIPPLGVSE